MNILDRITRRVGGLFDNIFEEVRVPDDLHNRLVRAQSALDAGRVEDALDALRRAEEQYPNYARLHHIKGRALLAQGAPQEAARALRRAIELKEQPQSHYFAGLAMAQIQEWRAAQDHLQRALTLAQDDALRPELHAELARVYLEQDRADKAIKEVRKGLRLRESDMLAAHITLARALLARGQVQEATAVIQHAEVARATDPSTHMVIAAIALARDDFDEALTAYERVADLDALPQQRGQALRGATRAALATGQIERATALMERASRELGEGSQGAEHHLLLARVAAARGDLSLAAQRYEQALALDPSQAEALIGSGELLLEANMPQAALARFKQALEVRVQHDPEAALLGLGRARFELGDLGGARQLTEEATKARRERMGQDHAPSPALLVLTAEIAHAAGDHAAALVALREAEPLLDLHPRLHARHKHVMDAALLALRPHLKLPAALSNPLDLQRTLHALQEYVASDPRLVDFIPATQRILTALDSPLSVAIVGEFNAGKSTLLNALIGEDILPTGVLPTTAHTGIIQYGPRQAARVVWRGEEDAVEVSFKEAKRLMKDNGEAIDHLQYLAPHPELRAVHYWDTPGFNALEERHEEVATRALEEAEAIVWVLDANQALSQTEFDRIKKLPSGAERLIVVLNKVDRLGEPEVASVVSYIEEHASAFIAGCYPVSALSARSAQRERAELLASGAPADAFEGVDEALGASGMPRFREHLHSQIIDRAGRIKALEATRHLGTLTLTLGNFQRGLIARYQGLGEEAAVATGWLQETWRSRPRRVSEFELMELEDGVDFLLRALTREIEEALRPRSSWVSQRMELGEEDTEYLVELMKERFESLLSASRERVMRDALTVEAELAERLGPITQGLSLQDARGLTRRLEGFQDEVRVLKLLLQERVYGRLMARSEGQIEAGARAALVELVTTRDHARWRGLLRPLLPNLREGFTRELSAWYDRFFTAASRLCERAQRDLSLLELEAEQRYDLEELSALIQRAQPTLLVEESTTAAPPPDSSGAG